MSEHNGCGCDGYATCPGCGRIVLEPGAGVCPACRPAAPPRTLGERAPELRDRMLRQPVGRPLVVGHRGGWAVLTYTGAGTVDMDSYLAWPVALHQARDHARPVEPWSATHR